MVVELPVWSQVIGEKPAYDPVQCKKSVLLSDTPPLSSHFRTSQTFSLKTEGRKRNLAIIIISPHDAFSNPRTTRGNAAKDQKLYDILQGFGAHFNDRGYVKSDVILLWGREWIYTIFGKRSIRTLLNT